MQATVVSEPQGQHNQAAAAAADGNSGASIGASGHLQQQQQLGTPAVPVLSRAVLQQPPAGMYVPQTLQQQQQQQQQVIPMSMPHLAVTAAASPGTFVTVPLEVAQLGQAALQLQQQQYQQQYQQQVHLLQLLQQQQQQQHSPGSLSVTQLAQYLAYAADHAAGEQHQPGDAALVIPAAAAVACAEQTVQASMPRDVQQLMDWPLSTSSAGGGLLAAAAAGSGFRQLHTLTFHNHGSGSRSWLPRHDGSMRHSLADGTAVDVQVTYDISSGPKGWPVTELSGTNYAVLKPKGSAKVTVCEAGSGRCVCTIELEFIRNMVLRKQQQQGGHWRPFKPRPGWLLGCVALNTFTGTVLRQEPAGVPLSHLLCVRTSPPR
jgi:hypothetical protein